MQSGEGMLEKSQFRGTSFDFIGLPIGSGVDAKNMVPFTASPNANCCSVMEMVVSEKQGECRGKKAYKHGDLLFGYLLCLRI